MAGRLWKYGAAALIVQMVAACSPSPSEEKTAAAATSAAASGAAQPAAAATPAADAPIIVVFGDSLYAGYNLDREEGFAPVLEHRLAGDGVSARVFNAGVSGDTTAAGLQRLAFMLDGLDRKPRLVVVGLGGNDMLRGLSPDQTRSNLDAILAELKKRDIPAMLTGMLASPNMGPDYAAAFNPIYPALARKYGIPLYPFFLDGVVGNPTLLLPDGIHPNAQGVQVVVGKIAPAIENAIKD